MGVGGLMVDRVGADRRQEFRDTFFINAWWSGKLAIWQISINLPY
jgi:hypothetical protein